MGRAERVRQARRRVAGVVSQDDRHHQGAIAEPGLVSRVNRRIGEASSYVYVVIFAITFGEVFLRYVFHAPTLWSLEVCLILAGTQYVLSGAHASERGAHIRIEVVYNLAPPRLRAWFDVVAHCVALAYLAVIVNWGSVQAYTSLGMWERSGSAWNSLQPAILKTAIPVAGALMFLQVVVQLAAKLKDLSRWTSRPSR